MILDASGSSPELPTLRVDAAESEWPPDPSIRRATSSFLSSKGLRRTLKSLPWLVFGLIVLACFAGPTLFNLPPPSLADLNALSLGIGAPHHLLGTDSLGYDLLSRTMVGGRVSIVVGFAAMLIGLAIGGGFGVVAGHIGRTTDVVIMRCVDVFLAFPSLILALCVSTALGPNERDEILAIAFLTVPFYARLARAATLRIRGLEYVIASDVMGSTPRLTIMRHIIPNVLPSLLTIAPLTVSISMVVEAGLSFLGAGVRPPTPSWGNMIAAYQNSLSTDPRLIIVPSVALFMSVLVLNLIGEQLRRWRMR
jgi:peptide/nickel transport system permease protein